MKTYQQRVAASLRRRVLSMYDDVVAQEEARRLHLNGESLVKCGQLRVRSRGMVIDHVLTLVTKRPTDS